MISNLGHKPKGLLKFTDGKGKLCTYTPTDFKWDLHYRRLQLLAGTLEEERLLEPEPDPEPIPDRIVDNVVAFDENMEVCQLYNDTKFDRTYSIRSSDYSDFTHEDEGPSLPYSSGSEWHNPSKETRPAQVVISRDDRTQYAFNVQEHPICDEGFPSVHDTPLDVNGNRLPDEDIPSTYYSVSRRHDYTYYGAMPSGSELQGSLPNGTYVTVNGLIKPNYLVKRSHEHLSESIAEVCANSKRYVQNVPKAEEIDYSNMDNLGFYERTIFGIKQTIPVIVPKGRKALFDPKFAPHWPYAV